MSKGRKIAIQIAAVGVIVVVGIGAYLHHVIEPGTRMGREVEQAQIRLLCETDHQALLLTCRQLARQVLSREPEGALYMAAAALQLPEPISTLRPNHVTIDKDGLVNIEMYTGWYPLGVLAFPEGYGKPSPGYGDRRLLEGLWYYEDGYSTQPDAYDKRIDELLSKNKRFREAR